MKQLLLGVEYPVAALQPHPKNYRKHNLPGIAGSLEAGVHRTIGVRANDPAKPLAGGTVLAGHGVFFASRDLLGREVVAATVVECDDAEAEEAVVRDNRWQEMGEDDPGALVQLLTGISERGRLEAVGYTAADLEDLLRGVEGPPSLEHLEAEYGSYSEAEGDEQLWPTFSVKLPRDLLDRWRACLEGLPGGTATEQMRSACQVIEEAAAP